MKKGKTGRNDLCPCGSGKKYKKCCLLRESLPDKLKNTGLPKEVVDYFNEQRHKNVLWQYEYGDVRSIIHSDFKGRKFVAVGNQVYYSDKWKTFPDFLIHYAAGVLGGDWGNTELTKPLVERHPIMQWYDGMCQYQQTHSTKHENGLYSCLPNGDYEAFINLAYDLYILRHHDSLQEVVVRKLKNKEQFQGARYELFAAATCIRAGYLLEYEDETDVTKKHPEFLGTHKDTGQKIHVEAKSRHRPGILGFKGEKQKTEWKAGVRRLLREALNKSGEHPYVVFLDLNLPPLTQDIILNSLKDELSKTVDSVCINDDKEQFNLIVFTNHPHSYIDSNDPDPGGTTMMIPAKNPLIVSEYPDSIIGIFYAAQQYGNIPNFFPE
ncbi:MAG: hypothetical protein BWY74_04060 [Firmicutes bacterium ADurb.Bin419]|nr:MAG: hypothetical protein BWY74_04060 [Firmicutes bacterium ADurb.Bin419]